MGRLENIIARNQRSNRNVRERVVVSFVFGGIILLIIGLMVFTDLGKPPVPPRPPASAAPAPVTAPAPRDKRVDGVLLRKASSRPAAPGNPTPAPAPAAR